MRSYIHQTNTQKITIRRSRIVDYCVFQFGLTIRMCANWNYYGYKTLHTTKITKHYVLQKLLMEISNISCLVG